MRLKPSSKSKSNANANAKAKAEGKAPRRTAGGRRMAARPSSRGRSRMARRPGAPLRSRIAARLPSAGRILAGLGAVAGIAVAVALVTGPWLRVAEVSWAGNTFTPPAAIERLLDDERGAALLTVDGDAVRQRLVALPSVVEARVTTDLAGRVAATVVEATPAFVWETPRARLVGAADGTLFASLALEDAPPEGLGGLPVIDDERSEARLLAVGDRIPAALLRTATGLSTLDPAALGSRATTFTLALDDDHGFRLHAVDPAWEVAFGMYGLDPRETAARAEARLERQVTAVRTLFADRDEDDIGWVDVRNPGKVYFRAKG